MEAGGGPEHRHRLLAPAKGRKERPALVTGARRAVCSDPFSDFSEISLRYLREVAVREAPS
jgi:hypothetical protein